jgi:hypothetical protein
LILLQISFFYVFKSCVGVKNNFLKNIILFWCIFKKKNTLKVTATTISNTILKYIYIYIYIYIYKKSIDEERENLEFGIDRHKQS